MKRKPDRSNSQLRMLCYLYILLLILEGAFRKWILPGLSDILLLVRDPVVLAAYFIGLTHKKFPHNSYVVFAFVLVVAWSGVTMLIGHGNPVVTVFGVRANFLHFPMAFIIGSVFYRRDIIQIGKWWLIGCIPMTVIICLQFYSPQSAWINQGVGGVGSAGFDGAMGRYRPPGTFSFIVGVVWFYVFATAFLVAGMTQHKRYSKWIIIAGAFAIITAIPVSISRMLILSTGLTFFVGLLVTSLQRNALIRYLRIAFFAVVGLFIAAQFPVFDDAKEAFIARWENSTGESQGGIEGAIIMRIAHDFFGPFVQEEGLPFFGVGIGAGTQVGNQLLHGTSSFQLGEGEWFRIIGEGGVIFGGLFILWRVALVFALTRFSIRAYFKGNGLALILLSTSILNILSGQIGQSTILGFTILGIGFTIASMRTQKADSSSSKTEQSSQQPVSA